MIILLVLFGSLLFFRGLGALGIPLFDNWHTSARFALAVMFLFTSSAHFNEMRHDLARMMPKIFHNPMGLVYFTGVCEILGAVGIVAPQTRSLAGLCLAVFLVAILPANIKAARERVTIGGRQATPLWLRVPMQILFLALVCWTTEPWRLWF
jgi:uncharacterized membrane protein